MAHAKHGDTVAVQYTGALNDGTVFETSFGSEPLRFRIGDNELIPPAPMQAIERAVIGMKAGESRKIRIPASDAYGSREEGMVVVVDRNRFPESLTLQLGMELDVHQADGDVYPVTVTNITDSSITLDANHPLAGKDLVFDIFLVEIL
ncbi:MAG: peptidylprolyl isomerase [Dehalococcoidia bacterium]|nr:MAG: peptidylprolyl isomerase [Dehalococcoidia bacterium]